MKKRDLERCIESKEEDFERNMYEHFRKIKRKIIRGAHQSKNEGNQQYGRNWIKRNVERGDIVGR